MEAVGSPGRYDGPPPHLLTIETNCCRSANGPGPEILEKTIDRGTWNDASSANGGDEDGIGGAWHRTCGEVARSAVENGNESGPVGTAGYQIESDASGVENGSDAPGAGTRPAHLARSSRAMRLAR
ncbi:hypothetical protein DVH05_002706 [Phytophthora capsici]|nr:hypothetical protein DVH05_002706 [Phytophthora capsici]